MSLDDLPLVGKLVGVVTLLIDVVAHSGELVVGVVVGLLGNVQLVVPIIMTLEKLGARLPWLPPGAFDAAVNFVLIAMLTVYALRLLGAVNDRRSST